MNTINIKNNHECFNNTIALIQTDIYSINTMLWLETVLGRKVGPSTGKNMVGVLQLAREMQEKGKLVRSLYYFVVGGDRYLNSYYSP